jgi:transglutaminase-like putative cysteine protease
MIARWLGRLLVKLIHQIGVVTLLSLILLGVAIGSIVNGLEKMVHNLDVSPFWLLIAGGVLFGWLLAKSPLPAWLAGPLSGGFGAVVLFLRVGRLETEFFSFVRAYLNLSVETWRVYKVNPYDLARVSTKPLSQAYQPLGDGFYALYTRVRLWLEAFIAGRGAFDPVATALVWGFVLWIVTVWAAWFVRRSDRVFVGLLPAVGGYAFVLYYTGIRTSFQALIVMLGAILLLYALRSYSVSERSWLVAKLDLVHSPWELGVTVVILTAGLMLVAALTPSLTLRQMANIFDELFTRRAGDTSGAAETLGLQARPAPLTVFDQTMKADLPTYRLIGSSPKLSKQPVLYVSIAGYDPFPEAAVAVAHPKIPPRYYWRNFTYVQYNGRGWYTGPVDVYNYSPDEVVFVLENKNYDIVRQRVQPLVDLGGFVYATGELQTLDVPYQVAWRGEGDALGSQTAASEYTAISVIPNVTEDDLRSAGTNYPEWVRQRYLQLPGNMPDRIQELAYDLTAVQLTPFDQALAIEAYLRTISYTLDVPTPPLGRDVVDYFLFDLKRGYCDYFATSMVVLARSVGIPARLVTGYASGGYDLVNARFVVLEEDAHSWVEVFFPGYGWIEFEPTSGRPPIGHGSRSENIPPAYNPSSVINTGSRLKTVTPQRIDLEFYIFVLLLAVSLGWLIWQGLSRWRTWRMSPTGMVTHAYHQLYRRGRWFGLRTERGQTPREFSQSLVLRIASMILPDHPIKPAVRARREGLVASIRRDLQTMTILYERSLFSPEPLNLYDKSITLKTWDGLRTNLRQSWWLGGMWTWLRRERNG